MNDLHEGRVRRGRSGRLGAVLLLTLLAPLGGCDDEPYPLEPEAAPALEAAAAPGTSLSTSSLRYLRPVGYVRVEWPDKPVDYPPHSTTYNSAGDSVKVELVQTGFYRVTFQSLAGRLNGLPHAQASALEIGHYGVTCSVPAVVVKGSDVVMTVLCTRDGRLANYKFWAQLYDHDADAAFATIHYQGQASNARLLSRVERTSTGRTRVYFRKDPFFGVGSYPNAMVTARGQGVTCELFSIGSASQRADEFGVEVDCYNAAGDRTALGEFHVLLLSKPYRTGYAFVANNALVDWDHSYNYSGRDIRVVRDSQGRYDVVFEGLQPHFYGFGTVKVTSHGVAGEMCRPWAILATADDGFLVPVVCTDATGREVDSRFTVMMTSRY